MKRFIVRTGLGIVMGGLLWGGLPANPAMAALVTFNFEGNVTGVGIKLQTDALTKGIFPTQTLSGSYTFESTTSGVGTSTAALFPGAIKLLDFTIGSYVVPSGAPPASPKFIAVANDPITGDAYVMRSSFNGSSLNGHSPGYFELNLSGGTSAFGSTSLPGTLPNPPSLDTVGPPIINPWDNLSTFSVRFNGCLLQANCTINGTLTKLTAAVPLPPAVILFGAGLVALIGLGAGTWRKRNNSLA